MLRINNKWITSHYKEELYTARRTKPMEEYLKVKYDWNEQTLNNIYWPSTKTVRLQFSHTKRMQTCKIMHGWLPLAHMRHHITGTNQCPGCKCNDKTINHFCQCPHPSITEKMTDISKQMRAKGTKLNIPKDVLHAITQTLTAYTRSTQSINHNYNTAIKTAIKYQQKIGIDMMASGFLSKQWLHTIHPSRNPTQTMNKPQQLIWMEFFKPLWKNRNKLIQRTINFFSQADNDKLAESIKWYCKNRHLILAHHNTHLADNIDLSSLQLMPLSQKQEWVRHFEVAKEAHKREQQLAETKQKSIQEYMISTLKKPTQPWKIHIISRLRVSPRWWII
jgi:hypothetical protein